MVTHVFDMLAQVFAREDVNTCFALLGDANMSFATRLSESGCRMIYVRHEHCAVAAAMAYARKTGSTGVATVTCGPGLTQLMTALPAAVRAHLPLVVLAGEAPLKSGWYNQAIQQAPFVEATGAAYHSLHWPQRMPVAIRDAFLQAQRERRPVVVGIPFDLQELEWSPTDLPPPSRDLLPHRSAMPANAQDLAHAALLIGAAERIVVMAGMGAVEADAGDACRQLAERCDGLLATSLPARGLFHDDPFSIGIAGGFSSQMARQCLEQSDLIIAVGCSLAQHNSDSGKLWEPANVLQIDVDPVATNQGRVVAFHHMRADAHLGVSGLLEHLTPRPARWRTPELAQALSDTAADDFDYPDDPPFFDPRAVVERLETVLPQDWELVNSSGHCSYFFAQMPSRPNRNFLTIREFGAIGNGISFAMGVAAARPDSPVVLFDGDGSLLMHVQELETILRHRMNILIVVLNDGGYGSEVHKLRAEGLAIDGAAFGRTDLAAIARGFGATGVAVKDLDDLDQLTADFAEQGGLTVWDFQVSDQVVSPVIRRSHAKPAPSSSGDRPS